MKQKLWIFRRVTMYNRFPYIEYIYIYIQHPNTNSAIHRNCTTHLLCTLVSFTAHFIFSSFAFLSLSFSGLLPSLLLLLIYAFQEFLWITHNSGVVFGDYLFCCCIILSFCTNFFRHVFHLGVLLVNCFTASRNFAKNQKNISFVNDKLSFLRCLKIMECCRCCCCCFQFKCHAPWKAIQISC